jgi:hypothetical protein
MLLLGACSNRLGYGVLLWELPEYGLEDGEILPVYVKSTISQVYVIGLPETNEKIEIPLWQITPPASRRKARALQKAYADYQRQYARTLLDGLPIRSEAVNTAKQMYRLRKGEIIKVLYKGVGQPVMAGQTPMEGDWLQVLTADGTQGWCFSHNLRLFDIRSQQTAQGDALSGEAALLAELGAIFARNWRPESYLRMIADNTIDLSQMNSGYGFTVNLATKKGRLYVPGVDAPFSFTAVTKGPGQTYTLEESPVSFTLRNSNLLAVSLLNQRGVPVSHTFIPMDESAEDIIRMEQKRRDELYQNLLALGPDFSSENYGILHFTGNNMVLWTGNRRLMPEVVSPGSDSRGTVEFKYFLAAPLKTVFDGVITINLTGSAKENYFFYSLRDGGIQLEDAGGGAMQNNLFTGRGANPIVMFFAPR